MRQRAAGLILSGLMMIAGARGEAGDPSDLCSAAAASAARASGVPVALIRIVMTAESGRAGPQGGPLRPWPWALNVEGQGHWPATEAEALAMVEGLLRDGRTSIDIGCFQINLRWHGQAFRSPADMFDPQRNATYAVGFLQELYRETGSWRAAAGAYHSRDPARAEGYVARLKSVNAAMASETAYVAADSPPPPTAPAAFSLRGSRGPIIAAGPRGPLLRMAKALAP